MGVMAIHTITIDDRTGGVLIPLGEVVRGIPWRQAGRIRLHDFRLHVGRPLGMAAAEFEALTRTPGGLVLDGESFGRLVSTDMQIIDGMIEFDLVVDGTAARLTVECIDATQWEISSDSIDVAAMADPK